MKTETQIAKKNIRIVSELKDIKRVRESLNVRKALSREHKASCERFLGFLKGLSNENIELKGTPDNPTPDMDIKIKDLKQAIKFYNEIGI